MAYRYFTKELLDKSNEIDIANIFPEKQQKAKEMLNTNYSLAEIVSWMRDNTNNFKKSENYFIDLDQAVKKVVDRYYESTNKANPFISVSDIELGNKQPRISIEVGNPRISNVVESVPESQPTKEDYQAVISGLEIQAEMDAENPIYADIIAGLKLQLEFME